jgi:hypothetical protein
VEKKEALQALSTPAEAVVSNGAAIAQRLEHSNRYVRTAALQAFATSKEAVTQHGAAIALRLEDSDAGVREAATKVLASVSPAALVPHAPELIKHGLPDADCEHGMHVSAADLEELRCDEDGLWRTRREFAVRYGHLVEWRWAWQCRTAADQVAADDLAERRAAMVEDARCRIDADGALSLSEEALAEAREAGDAGRIEAAEADVERAREDVRQHGAVRPGDAAMVFDADASAQEAE